MFQHPLLSASGFDVSLIDQSAWLDGSADYRQRQFAAFTNKKELIVSAWVRRTGFGSQQAYFGSVESSSAFILGFSATDRFLYSYAGADYRVSTAEFRDVGWYHIVVSIDTSQVTANNRIKVFVNGVEITAWDTQTNPVQNAAILGITGGQTGAEVTLVGAYNNSVSNFYFWNGYIAQICMIAEKSVQQGDHAITDFGENYVAGSNGTIWVPLSDAAVTSIASGGAANSFCLVAAIGDGADASSKSNNFSTSGGSMTHAANGSEDTPSLSHALFNGIWNGNVAITLSEGATKANLGTGGGLVPLTQAVSGSEKIYLEVVADDANGSNFALGVADAGIQNSVTARASGILQWENDGDKYKDGVQTATDIRSWSDAAVLGLAIDMANNKLWIRDATGWQPGVSADPATNTGGESFPASIGEALLVIFGNSSGSQDQDATLVVDAASFTYAAPAGFKTLNSANLTAPAYQGADFFNAILYTGDAVNNRALTGMGFQADKIVMKRRTGGILSWKDVDALRGTGSTLKWDTTAVEAAETWIDSLDADGLTIDNANNANDPDDTYIAYGFKAGGAGVSNSDGSITSTISVAGAGHLSIGTYTGTGSVATIGHGLGVVPECVVTKIRTGIAASWAVFHKSMGATKSVFLDLTTAESTSNAQWNDTGPTGTVFSVRDSNSTNRSAGTYTFEAFASVAGVCEVGSYTGNGNADGPFVHCGFKPRWILIRCTNNGAQSWFVHDTVRGTVNPLDTVLFPGGTNQDTTNTTYKIDVLANGFKIRGTNTGINSNAKNHLFVAMAEVAGGGTLPPIPGR